jgi:hypothetical protein
MTEMGYINKYSYKSLSPNISLYIDNTYRIIAVFYQFDMRS